MNWDYILLGLQTQSGFGEKIYLKKKVQTYIDRWYCILDGYVCLGVLHMAGQSIAITSMAMSSSLLSDVKSMNFYLNLACLIYDFFIFLLEFLCDDYFSQKIFICSSCWTTISARGPSDLVSPFFCRTQAAGSIIYGDLPSLFLLRLLFSFQVDLDSISSPSKLITLSSFYLNLSRSTQRLELLTSISSISFPFLMDYSGWFYSQEDQSSSILMISSILSMYSMGILWKYEAQVQQWQFMRWILVWKQQNLSQTSVRKSLQASWQYNLFLFLTPFPLIFCQASIFENFQSIIPHLLSFRSNKSQRLNLFSVVNLIHFYEEMVWQSFSNIYLPTTQQIEWMAQNKSQENLLLFCILLIISRFRAYPAPLIQCQANLCISMPQSFSGRGLNPFFFQIHCIFLQQSLQLGMMALSNYGLLKTEYLA